ncbi:hypothetical protein AMTRI_Chr13g90410 [Amborella trichopoda]
MAPLPAFSVFLVFSTIFSSSYEALETNPLSERQHEVLSWRGAEEDKNIVILEERIHREESLQNYEHYNGGQNMSDPFYWTLVLSKARCPLAVAVLWFPAFGVLLILLCCCCCCCPRRLPSNSRVAYALSLIFLILFTCAAIVGCIVLYTGQGKFYRSTKGALEYVVDEANLTVTNLKNFSNSISAAKRIGVHGIFLPLSDQAQIDTLASKLNSSADTLQHQAEDNSDIFHFVLNLVRDLLIVVASVMLLLEFLGFLFSIRGLQVLVYILVTIGWVLVPVAFIFCGVALIVDIIVSDACVAMHQDANSTLVDILPCVDAATANKSLYQSKEISYQMVNVVNQVISNVSNQNSSRGAPSYYNQSGPLVPVLCNPFNFDFTLRNCRPGEVTLNNAMQVWQGYTCKVSSSGLCSSVGRLTPDMYNQMVAATNVSYELYNYGHFLNHLQNCTFVRDIFDTITKRDCPRLRLYSKWIYIGLVIVSSAVMLSLIVWLIHARERRHRKYIKILPGVP